jgi:beta-galactosidase
MEPNGVRVTHGNRAHGSPTSPRYLAFCRRIADALATRFGHDPNVVGWQIDNEYGYALMSYDSTTQRQFQDWLRAKYVSLDSLNRRWATAYWSQTYDAWTEIPIPVGPHNPALMLDWKRFVTDAWTAYQQNQLDAIRAHADPRQFVTGNFMGWWDGVDNYTVSAPLTFVAWDDYVGTGHLDPVANGLNHDLMRGLRRDNFWEIETQPGSVNWSPLNNALNKGEVRAMAWHAIGHGADEVSYWQWRSAPNGQEEIHGTLVGADGTPVPLLAEVAQTAGELARTQDAFRGTRVVSEVALINDYPSRWALDWQSHTNRWDTRRLVESYYRAVRAITQSVDVVGPAAPLDGYRLVIAPSLTVLPDSLARRLLAYAHAGGHLVLGPRSGLKDEYNGLNPQRQPGLLADALGARVEQYYALESPVPVGDGHASVWAEWLHPSANDVDVRLRYGTSNGWLDGQPAVVTRRYGAGRLTYIGTVLDDTLLARTARWMTHGIAPAFGPVPDGVEVSRRIGSGGRVYVLINFASRPRTVALPRVMRSLLDGRAVRTVRLATYGVAVLSEQRAAKDH